MNENSNKYVSKGNRILQAIKPTIRDVGIASIFGALGVSFRQVWDYVLIPLSNFVFPRLEPIGYLSLLLAVSLLVGILTAWYVFSTCADRVIVFDDKKYEFDKNRAFVKRKRNGELYFCSKCLLGERHQESPLKENKPEGSGIWECMHPDCKDANGKPTQYS